MLGWMIIGGSLDMRAALISTSLINVPDLQPGSLDANGKLVIWTQEAIRNVIGREARRGTESGLISWCIEY